MRESKTKNNTKIVIKFFYSEDNLFTAKFSINAVRKSRYPCKLVRDAKWSHVGDDVDGSIRWKTTY